MYPHQRCLQAKVKYRNILLEYIAGTYCWNILLIYIKTTLPEHSFENIPGVVVSFYFQEINKERVVGVVVEFLQQRMRHQPTVVIHDEGVRQLARPEVSRRAKQLREGEVHARDPPQRTVHQQRTAY